MSRYVIDASVAIKWFLPEPYAEAAERLRPPSHQLHAPTFFWLEIGNVLCKKIRRAELRPEEAEFILGELRHIPLRLHPDERLFGAAYDLALCTRRSLYDCLYLALAEAIEGTLVTADRKFFVALADGQYGRRMLWVEDLAQPS
ncbi:PIN domain-containing protein [Nitrospira tepida]|uniref:PIN domain-containing protein n=1 Tax=Nitrospira tepida TaxID=2973512 RepID=A0AA86N434_9BACT|nr:type II toxin-antitoxin system VapC family toxin [Nitrospira tepida]CAI4034070.1 PIN domain-containing protein [Nitrospira tepida]